MKSCTECPARSKCTKLCKKMERYVNGNAPRKEPLLRDIITEGLEVPSTRDYKDMLAELSEDREARIEYILSIPKPHIRAIAAMLLAGIPRGTICIILNMSYRQLSRIIKDNKELYVIRHVKTSVSDYIYK